MTTETKINEILAHAHDFAAGFYAASNGITAATPSDAYRSHGAGHGITWEEGFSAAIDLSLGAYATTPALAASRLGLA